MTNKEYAEVVLRELTHTLTRIDSEQAEKFVELVDGAKEVFCAGAGRSGFEIKGFAMRLMHMGIASYVVGETCTQILMKMECWLFVQDLVLPRV